MIYAHPHLSNVEAGKVQFSENGSLFEVRASDGAIINWTDFSIAPSELTRFIQPSANARVLNRVTGKTSSSLLGTLESNGQVFLLNANGVLIGKDARIKVGGFFVTTFELSDRDFLEGNPFKLDCGSQAGILNCGQIEALDGEIYLVAKTIENEGSLTGQNVTLASGGQWIVQAIHPNRPAIKVSDLDCTNPYGSLIKHSGQIQAVGCVEKEGIIRLISEDELVVYDQAEVFTLKGGDVSLLARDAFIGPSALIRANGNGDGGSVSLLAGNTMQFSGRIEAEGGEKSGDGGFVEVSGKKLSFEGTVSTIAPKGKMGTLLLDPLDLMISSAPNFAVSAPPTFIPSDPACMSNLNTGVLTAALTSSHVTVQTLGTVGACAGDITVIDPFSWATGSTLTFDSANDVNIRAKVEATGSGKIVVQAVGNVAVDPVAAAGPAELRTNTGSISISSTMSGNITVQGGSLGMAHSGIFSDKGTITLTPGLNLTVAGGFGFSSYAEISSREGPIIGSIPSGGTLTVQGNGINAYGQIGMGAAAATVAVNSNITFNFDISSMDLDVLGGSMSGAYAQIGHAPHPAGPGTTVAGNITFNPTNLGVGNNINVTGGGVDASAIIGHGNEFTPDITNASGNFQIYAQGAISVQGGTSGDRSHAVIGFHTPEGGPSAPYTATSSLLDVRTLISGDINVNGGTGSNGIIGYYNNTTLSASANVDITSLHVQPTDTNEIILTAGNRNATAHGAAVLGTMDLGGSANSNISTRSGGIQVLGPQLGANDGAARLINGRPNVNVGRTMLIDCASTPLISDILVLGGLGLSPGFAEIYSSGTMNLLVRGHLYINRTVSIAPILQNGPAKIVSYGAITINGLVPCLDLQVVGGNNSSVGYHGSALLQSVSSNILFGTETSPGGGELVVGYTTSEAPSQILTSAGTSVFSYTLAGTIQGGQTNLGAPSASAEIRSDVGNIEMRNGSSLSVLGGTGSLCFAEISSTFGDILIQNIFGPITLSGGTTISGINAYAQIGRGVGIATTQVNSNITFDNIGAVTLTAFDGPGAYVQIGQSPSDAALSSIVTGNVTFNSGAATLLLQGGSVPTNTAIIGHGNELTPRLTSVIGSIDVIVNAGGMGLLYASPTVGRAHAIIGFCNPLMGSLVPFTVNSQSVSLLNRGFTNLKAENFGSNATIGYYNGFSPQANTVNITIQQITLNADDGSQDVLLEAGSDPSIMSVGAASVGIAAIGTLVNSAGSTAVSNISVNADMLTLQGPTAGNNGAARIVNNLPNAVNPLFSVSIQPTTDINVLGGVGLPNGFADIYSCNTLSIQCSHNLYINEAFPIFQNGYAHVVGYQDVDVNTSSFGNEIRLTGGNSFMMSGGSADALIQSLNGHCFVGGFSPAALDIYIGRSGSQSPSKVEAFQNTAAVAASQDLILQGGSANMGAPFATAQIRNLNGAINITVGRDLSVFGGTGPDTYAQIGTFLNVITVNQVGRNLTLTGGTGLRAYAQIGIGNNPTIADINSSIFFNFVGGTVILNGAMMGDSGYAQIGHSPFGAMILYRVQGDVQFPTFGSIGLGALNGGAVDNTTAIIGHGNPLTPFLSFASGNISAGSSSLMGITLNAGTGSESHAVIGFFNPVGGSTPSFTVNSGQISIATIQGPVNCNANVGMNATIGYYHPAASMTPISVQISNIFIQTGSSDAAGLSNFINLNANTGFPNGIASIGTFGPAGSTTQSSIGIQAVELNLNGPGMGMNGAARVINNQPFVCAPNDVNIQAKTINVLGGLGTGFSDIYSSNDLNVLFNGAFNVNLNPASPATLQNGNATVTSCKDVTVGPKGFPPNNLGDINVLGGTNTTVLSQITSTMGDIHIGKFVTDMDGANNVVIGRADMMGPARIFSQTGNMEVVTKGYVNVLGGAAPGTDADLTAFGSLQGDITNSFNLFGGTFGNATSVAGNGPLTIISQFVNAFAQASSSASIVQLGLNNDLLQIEAVEDISISLNSFVQNQGSGLTVLNASNNGYLTENSYVQALGGGLNFFTGISMFLLDASQVLTNGGTLSLIVDNLYPTPASGIGNGAFEMDVGASVNSNGGATRIFTANRSQNRVEGMINGIFFVPGPEYVNSATEIWGVYFFSSLGGSPFTIFYKELFPPPVVPAINNLVRRINNEYNETMKYYDFFLFAPIPIKLFYKQGEIDYLSLRRLYRDYHLLIIDTLGSPL